MSAKRIEAPAGSESPPPSAEGGLPPRPTTLHAALVGRLWKLIGAGLMIAAPFLFYYVVRVYREVFGPFGEGEPSTGALASVTVVSVASAVGCFLAGRTAFRRGKKVLALHLAERALRDPRPPVVYLRSFQDDERAAVAPEASGLQMMLGSATEEEQLAAAMSEIGPFVAIGRPGEKLPELGAARFYVGHEEWQDRVRELVSRASLVVLRVGRTPGFFWEVERAAQSIPPERLVFLLPYSTEEYEEFRRRAHGSFPVPLPPFSGGPSLSGSFLGGVLYFERDWTPRILKLRVPFHLTLLGKILNPLGYLMRGFRLGRPFVSVFKRTLKPLLENNGLRWRWPPRHPLLTVEAWLMIGTWAYAFWVWFGMGR